MKVSKVEQDRNPWELRLPAEMLCLQVQRDTCLVETLHLKKKKHHLSKCNWRFFTLCRPFSVTFNYIYKTPLFASKQKWFSSHNTLRNLLWGIFVLRNKRWYGRTCALSVYVINSFCHWLIVQLCPKSVDLWKIAWIIIITFNLVEKYLKDNSHLCFTHNLYLFKNSRILNVYVFLFEM